MPMPAIKRYSYRVKMKNKSGDIGEFVADSHADIDETARRKIIAAELKIGNCVMLVTPTTDRTKKPGDWSRRSYKSE